MLVGGFHTTPGEYSPACWDKALQTFRQVRKLMIVRGRFGCSHRNKPLYRDKKIPWNSKGFCVIYYLRLSEESDRAEQHQHAIT